MSCGRAYPNARACFDRGRRTSRARHTSHARLETGVCGAQTKL